MPSTFDIWVIATIFVRSLSACSKASSENEPSSATSTQFRRRALALAMEMPGHDVGVMLHHGEHDLVAGPDMGEAEAGGDEVDRLGRRAGEDDLVGRGGVEEAAHAFRAPPHRLRSRRWRDSAGRDGRWRIRARRRGSAGRSPPSASGPRRRCRDRRAACRTGARPESGSRRESSRRRRVDGADHVVHPIVSVVPLRVVPAALRPASQTASRARNLCASASSSTRAIASAPKASSSIASASAFGRPRACR